MGNHMGGVPSMEKPDGAMSVNGVGMELGTNVDGVHGMEGNDGVGSTNGGTCGEELGVEMDGGGAGGQAEGDPRHGEKPAPKRKPLRGKRWGKKISEQEKEKLALMMKRWLGLAPPRTRETTLEEGGEPLER